MKKASFPILLIYSVIASIGIFDRISINPILKLVAILPLASFAVMYGNWYLREDRPSGFDRLVFGLLSLVLVKAVFLYLTGSRLDSFPLDILMLVVLATIHPLTNAIVYTIAAVLLNLAHKYFAGEPLPSLDNLYRIIGLFSTVVIVGRLLLIERRARVKAEGLWGGVESLATNILAQAKERNSPSLAISEAEKERLFLDSAGDLNSSLTRTLETIQSTITGSYSCCLFIPRGDIFKLSAAISPSKRLIYEVPRQKGKSLINWIEEHGSALCMDRMPDYRALGYYSADEGVNHFLGVPVVSRDNETKAVLCIDRKDVAYTKEDERLLTLAAASVAVFLENSNLISQMRIESREFSAFYQLVKKLGTTLDLDDILNIAMNFSKEIIDYDMTSIALKDDNGVVKFVAARGSNSSQLLTEGSVTGKEFLGWVMEKGIPIQFLISRTEKKVIQRLPHPLEKMGSFLCMPLIVNNQAIGIFITARKQDMSYSPYEVKLLEALSAHVSVAVSNARIYSKMEELATKDGLTGLHNYRFFQERLSHEIERGTRYNQRLALVLLDIDFFKKVNDTYGHPAGDKVIKGISAILAASVREVDLAARYGGEEFAVILINIDTRDAYTIAERIRTSIESTDFDIGDGKKIRVTSSMGISAYPEDGDNQRLLISMADSALYRAKKDGRNRVYLYSQQNSKAI